MNLLSIMFVVLNRGHLKRTYDKPKTPFQRVLDSKHVSPRKKKELKNLYATLNPVKLKREIEQGIKKLNKISEARIKNHKSIQK
jgi:hypothetical protein